MRLPAQTQLLLNPGLEAPYVAVSSSHIATNWTDDAYFGASLLCSQETTNVHSGASCQKIVVDGLTATTGALFYQPFIFNAGDVYQASIWLRSASNSLLQFALRDANNSYRQGPAAWQPSARTGSR